MPLPTRATLTASAVVLGLCGVALTFAPDEIGRALGLGAAGGIVLQCLGACYFGFAVADWMARGNLVGGIYGRPLAMANLAHFVIGAFALVRAALAAGNQLIVGAAVVYAILAAAFAAITFTSPVGREPSR